MADTVAASARSTTGLHAEGEKLRTVHAVLYGLDIETDTNTGGLDPTTSSVIAIAIADADGGSQFVFNGDELGILTGLRELLFELEPATIVTWNGSSFDLAFIVERCKVHAVELGWNLWESRRVTKYPAVGGVGRRATMGKHQHIDIAYPYQPIAAKLGVAWSLKPVASALGLAPVEVDREHTHLLSAAELEEYVASDARCTAILAARLDEEELKLWVD